MFVLKTLHLFLKYATSFPETLPSFRKRCSMKKRPVAWRELGVAQMLADDFHLTFQEAVTVLVVAVLLQFGPEWGAFSHPSVKALQGCGGFPSRAIKKRQLYLGIRTDDERFFFGILLFFFCHLFDCLLVDYL